MKLTQPHRNRWPHDGTYPTGTHTMVQGSGNVYKNQETFIVGIHEPSGNHFFMSFPGTL